MAISYQTLRSAANTYSVEVAKSVTEAKERGRKTAFLCHSHSDRSLVEGFVKYVRQKGRNVYIDWMDTTLPPTPSRATASRIKSKIVSCDLFIFLATHNSMNSRWCPWEIGYADGVKKLETILIVPTESDNGTYYGNEYLQLYRKLDVSSNDRFAFWEPGASHGTVATSL